MKQVVCTIKGITPLLMHRFPTEPVEALEKKSREEQAEIAAYRDPEGRLYVPGICVRQALVSAATYSKGKGRASLQKPVAACVQVMPERIILVPQEYTIDSRAVVVPATKGRVLRHRPRFDDWSLTMSIEWDENLLKEDELRRVMDDAGSRVGLLDFRPERKGSFGRFVVIEWRNGD